MLEVSEFFLLILLYPEVYGSGFKRLRGCNCETRNRYVFDGSSQVVVDSDFSIMNNNNISVVLMVVTGMDAVMYLFFEAGLLFCRAQQKVTNSINQSSSLTPTGNSSWLSPSGLSAFGFHLQGNNRYRLEIFIVRLVVNNTIVWTANQDDPHVSDDVTLHLNIDGRLILQHKFLDSNTYVVNHDQSISSASMLDTGNFVLYDSN
ncbi:G-type lectin S-receptor-like serine/threonine-protein kinase SD1-29 [Heracleum sosnowskyi]|uniref:G-type lectin S-receptor-like serine/threonine-protein kinase SD1-29 n=1 Tax=Heracleum sosnowskyi TaxID=360622 RepID=A0AAD8MRE8_9APIA|nr:G-type lectin S-receptor-like serine/threonine-protein kinase SD1-29 [Heracleum sosnowskyi]